MIKFSLMNGALSGRTRITTLTVRRPITRMSKKQWGRFVSATVFSGLGTVEVSGVAIVDDRTDDDEVVVTGGGGAADAAIPSGVGGRGQFCLDTSDQLDDPGAPPLPPPPPPWDLTGETVLLLMMAPIFDRLLTLELPHLMMVAALCPDGVSGR